jgi:hypothetical protein
VSSVNIEANLLQRGHFLTKKPGASRRDFEALRGAGERFMLEGVVGPLSTRKKSPACRHCRRRACLPHGRPRRSPSRQAKPDHPHDDYLVEVDHGVGYPDPLEAEADFMRTPG